jgi:mannose-6-phosphate isomerase-like protein (cupin superfamily)
MKFAVSLLTLACPVLFAQVPVEQEPVHHAGFHNQMLYVLEPQIPAGHTTLQHTHSYDAVTVCIQGSLTRAKPAGGEWGPVGVLCEPGRVNMTESTGSPRSHTVENTGTQTYHLTLVENLRQGGWTTLPTLTDAGLMLTKESRAFRSYEVRGAAAHSHAVPAVVVLVSGEVTTVGEKLVRPGAAAYIPAGQSHTVVGNGKAVEIEVR